MTCPLLLFSFFWKGNWSLGRLKSCTWKEVELWLELRKPDLEYVFFFFFFTWNMSWPLSLLLPLAVEQELALLGSEAVKRAGRSTPGRGNSRCIKPRGKRRWHGLAGNWKHHGNLEHIMWRGALGNGAVERTQLGCWVETGGDKIRKRHGLGGCWKTLVRQT